MKILVTGAAGFIAGYVVAELLKHGHQVVGIDNFSKYGPVAKAHDGHPGYRFVFGDCKDVGLMTELAADCDRIVAGAAMIGGISYFHQYAYDLLAENERITASTFDAAIAAHRAGRLSRIVVLSSSMVFESASTFPTPESEITRAPPPASSYGFQKLAVEYFARAAHQQYGLPFTIARPFNCVGVGEGKALGDAEIMSGNVRLSMSHVLPDLAQKVLKGQDPLHILGDGGQVRCYTHGSDLARGIRLCVERDEALNDDFNLSTPEPTTVLELAALVWREVHGDRPFRHASDAPFEYDVQRRVPDTAKAARVLGFAATVPVAESVREVVGWVRAELAAGRL
ncbi:NAD(P)-dependent oxidoreductase [Skermanella rosea]|uniref:NAD-dependent epimerase/dehydratase family protein n=1 Tax=Skermanella rosea TaxID=1817965 RepID=UPI0019337229|nr:NAD(P)-dependent oxidoreductase [Skermanella rosea]UEM04240.1 NAD(P)-dependent oxidoreductase [Skermanella rosea]